MTLLSEHLLRKYQCRTINKIVREPICAGFIDMGLGKTIIVLTAIQDIKDIRGEQGKRPVRWLVVAPIKVCETVWRQEAKKWEHTQGLTFSLIRGNAKQRAYALSAKADIYLINPELIHWLVDHLRQDLSMFTCLVVDESSLFKDHRSRRFTSLTNYGKRLGRRGPDGKVLKDDKGKRIFDAVKAYRFKRAVILTGTPRPNTLLNLWSQIYILDQGYRLHTSFDTYRSRYFRKAGEVAKRVARLVERDEDAIPDEPYDGAPRLVHEKIADISVDLDAEDYAILPKIIPVPHMVELPDEFKSQYKSFEKDAVLELEQNTVIAMNGGVKTMMCWQMANGAIFRNEYDGSRRLYDELHSAKLDELDDIINQIDDNVVICYNFKHDLERIRARHPDAIVLPRQAEKVVNDWNNRRIRKLLLHPKSGSHGLNIQYGGNHIIWFSMTWSLEQFDQANRRLARPGQPCGVGVHCHTIQCAKTTDELMYASVLAKGDDQARFRSALRKYQEAKQLGIYTHELA